MGSLHTYGYPFELVTGALRDDTRWSALGAAIDFLRQQQVASVRLEYGFVLSRELAGRPQPEDRTIAVDALEAVVRDGLTTGTIEWAGISDFVVQDSNRKLALLLCNDRDLHVGTNDRALADEVAILLAKAGVEVFGPFERAGE